MVWCGGDGGNEVDDDSLRKIKAKQTQAAKKQVGLQTLKVTGG